MASVLFSQSACAQGDMSMIDQANSDEHIAAISRGRRIVVNFDAMHADPSFANANVDALVEYKFGFIDTPGTQIDSVFWNWNEGNTSPFPSDVIPTFNDAGFQKWFEEGTDIVRIFLEETKKRKLEAFYSYRINGSDNDPHYQGTIPFKEEHPEWLLDSFWTGGRKIYLNFALPEVRELKLNILREIAERYDFDGIELDFARTPLVLPAGRQWEMRNHLTDFMRSVRQMMFEVAKKRRRPLLLAVRIPENIEGCHLDGIDIETWVAEQLVDLLVLGVRNFDVDIQAFRRITAGTNIKLYPCFDDVHGSDGYVGPPIEVIRGVCANWWSQGADGIYTFNWAYARPGAAAAAGLGAHQGGVQPWQTQLQAYQEIGSAETLARKDAAFVVQRKGGGHSNVPSPDDWHTPRTFYFNTNALAQLPAELDNKGKADALITVYVPHDLVTAERIESVTLRVLLSDPAAKSLPADQTIGQAEIRRYYGGWVRHNAPPSKEIVKDIKLRLNGGLLREPEVENGWLVFRPDPQQFAAGDNLVGIILNRASEAATDDDLPPQWWVDFNELKVKGARTVPYREPGSPSITVEKLEVHVKYRQP